MLTSLVGTWWAWVVLGFALGVLEILAPGYIFLGFAIGAVLTGAVLLKPDMSHVETDPDIFVPWETYAPLAWDLSDFADVLDPTAEGLDLTPMLELLCENADVLKVFHAGGQDIEIFVTFRAKEPPAALHVADQRMSLVLRRNGHLPDARVQRIRQGEVDDPGLAAEIDGRFRTPVRQLFQSAAPPARQHKGHGLR